MLITVTAIQAFILTRHLPARDRREEGQATAEYALVLLGAAAIALILVAWAARSGKVGDLFDAVFDQLMDRAG
jgi:Flp pilus assembly pilin Flp